MINFITAVLLILFAAFSRLLPHPENFAPVAATAIFAGLYLNKKYALLIPLAAVFLSDLFLGLYPYALWVYGTYVLIALINIGVRAWYERSVGVKKASLLCGTTIFSSMIFFIVTNFGVWTSGLYYEMNFSGLMESYAAAIPFFRMTLLADVVYVSLMVGAYILVLRILKQPALSESKVLK